MRRDYYNDVRRVWFNKTRHQEQMLYCMGAVYAQYGLPTIELLLSDPSLRSVFLGAKPSRERYLPDGRLTNIYE